MPEEIVYAVHNFEAENEDEISFTSGEPIVVLEKDEKYQDGWWQGRNVRGEIGLFPENYTTSKKPQQQQQLTSPPTVSSSMLSTNSSSSSSIKQSTSLFNEERYDSAISHIDLPPADKLGTSPPPPPPPLTIMQQPQQPPPTSVPPPPPPDAKATAGIGAKENPEDWSIEEVAEWLQSVGLSNVTDNFIEQEITGDILLSLTSESLKELGITAYGRRYRVMNALEKLKAEHGLQNNNNKAIDTVAPISSSSSSSSKLHTASINVDASIQQQQQPPQPPMRSPPRSPVATDSMYEFPRKAPMPPLAGANGAVASDAAFHHRRPTDSLLTTKSPASSATVSRSNTFQTLSSKVSSSSSSVRSRERSPDPARATGTFSHKLTQKSTISDSQDLDARPSIDTQNIMYSIRENGNYDQPFASDHDNIHPTSPLNTRSRNMSVASVEPSALPRMSTNSYQPPEHEGWLHKQGDKYKTWNKRWFVLKGPNLFYFKSPKDVRMKGIIHLKGYKIIADETIYPGKYSFKAKHDRERTFFFYTDTKESMRTWIKMLMKATITRDFDAPVMSSSHLATIPLDVARQMRPRPPSMIMYNKPQQQQKHGFNSGNTGGALHEEDENAVIAEEQQHAPIQDGLGSNLSELSHKQLRESGITVWPHGALGEDTPDVPDKFMFDETIPAPTLSSSIVMSDDDEDMIDPHHHKSFLPTPDSSSARVVAAPNMEKELSRSSSESFQETSNNYSSNNNNTDGQSRTWTRAQYLEWINRYLPPGKRVIDLTGAFRNGDTLILLLEALSGKTVRRPPTPKGGSVSMQMLDNIVAAFKFMGREGVVVDGRYTIKDIFGGNESKIMDMLDAIRTWSEENNFSQP